MYVAAIGVRTGSVQSIARAARSERTGTYDVLERLAARGYLRLERVGKRTSVVVEPPRLIRDKLSDKLMAAEAVLPRLEALFRSTVDNFSAEQVSGVAALEQFVHLVSTGFDPLRLLLGAVSIADAIDADVIGDRLTPLSPLLAGRKTNVLIASALGPGTQRWLAELKQHLPCRRLPSPTLIPTSQLIGGDSVATVGAEPDGAVLGVVISPSIAAHDRAVFDVLWRTAKLMV